MDGGQINADWAAVDWGTSTLRAWAMTSDGSVLAEMTSDHGMGTLAPNEFEGVLLDALRPWVGGATPLTVVACGMVGSRQGWVEAPYNTVPCVPQSGSTMVKSDQLTAYVLGGVKQMDPPDVMRGEETQIAGFLHLNPKWDGVVCLPGTHTKWALISAGEIVSFQTFMTGELFALLSGQSVLRHAMDRDWDADVFLTSVDDAMSRPAAMASRLFQIRAEDLTKGLPPGAAAARLSGQLIGAELAAARPYWLGQSVAVIGARPLVNHYEAALQAQGVPVIQTDAAQMTLTGLKAAFTQVEAVL